MGRRMPLVVGMHEAKIEGALVSITVGGLAASKHSVGFKAIVTHAHTHTHTLTPARTFADIRSDRDASKYNKRHLPACQPCFIGCFYIFFCCASGGAAAVTFLLGINRKMTGPTADTNQTPVKITSRAFVKLFVLTMQPRFKIIFRGKS